MHILISGPKNDGERYQKVLRAIVDHIDVLKIRTPWPDDRADKQGFYPSSVLREYQTHASSPTEEWCFEIHAEDEDFLAWFKLKYH